MTETIRINNDTWILRCDIRLLSPLTAEDQTQASERYNIDGSQFQTRLVMADKSLRLVRESVQDLETEQGLHLIEISKGRWVPAANIRSAKPYTKEDAKQGKENGLTLKQRFKAKVETSAGQILSTMEAQALMRLVAELQGKGGGQRSNTESEAPKQSAG